MKWLIRLLCFLVTFLIYIPIESALHTADTSAFLSGIITLVFFFFVFYVPSNALIAMWNKRRSAPSDTPPSQRSSASAQSSTPQEAMYFFTTKDGQHLRIPESKLDNYYAANTSKETVHKAKRLCSHLWISSMRCVKDLGFPLNYYYITFFWNALYLSVQDIAIKNKVHSMMHHKFNQLVTDFFKDSPERAPLQRNLSVFQVESCELLKRSNLDAFTKDGVKKTLQTAIAIDFPGKDSISSKLPPVDEITMTEYLLAVAEVNKFAIELFAASDL